MFSLVATSSLFAQEGEYTSSIQQPAKDTIYSCPGTNIVFIGLGHNSDGSAFDDNQVVFTWEFGNEETTMVGSTVVFAFEEGGHYLVKLKVMSISDSADHSASRDLRKFYQAAATNSAALTMNLVQELAKMNMEKTTNKSNGGDNQQVEPIVKTPVD